MMRKNRSKSVINQHSCDFWVALQADDAKVDWLLNLTRSHLGPYSLVAATKLLTADSQAFPKFVRKVYEITALLQ
jgi:hypothetical protein